MSFDSKLCIFSTFNADKRTNIQLFYSIGALQCNRTLQINFKTYIQTQIIEELLFTLKSYHYWLLFKPPWIYG